MQKDYNTPNTASFAAATSPLMAQLKSSSAGKVHHNPRRLQDTSGTSGTQVLQARCGEATAASLTLYLRICARDSDAAERVQLYAGLPYLSADTHGSGRFRPVQAAVLQIHVARCSSMANTILPARLLPRPPSMHGTRRTPCTAPGQEHRHRTINTSRLRPRYAALACHSTLDALATCNHPATASASNQHPL